MARGNVRVSITAEASGVKRAVGEAESSLQGLGRAGNKVGGSLKSTLLRATAAATGITAFSGAVVEAGRQAINFDAAMRNVNSIAQLNEQQFGKLEQSVLNLAGKTAQAPQTLAQGLYDLVSSGFKGKEALTVLEASATAATAGLTDTATSVKAVAAVLNAYHRPAADAKQISDDLFQTVNLGVVSFEELAQNIGDVLPFATALHVGLKQVGAATATMTKAGVSAPETMTRIKGAMTALIKPTDQLKVVFKHLGVATGEELIRKTGSFQGALEALSKAVGGNKEAMAKLFPDIRGLGGALLLTGRNAKSAAGDLRGLSNDTGATSTALKEQAKSLTYQWHKFKAEVSAITIRVVYKAVDWLSKAKKDVTEYVAYAKRKMEESKHDTQRTAFSWGGMLTAAWDSVKDAAKGVLKGFLPGALRATGGAVNVLVGVLTGRLGVAWSGVKDTASGAVKAMIGLIGDVPGPVRSVANAISSALSGAFHSAVGAARDLLGIIGNVNTAAADAGSSLADKFRNKTPVVPHTAHHTGAKAKASSITAHASSVHSDISADDLANQIIGGGASKAKGTTTAAAGSAHRVRQAAARAVRKKKPKPVTRLERLDAGQARAELTGSLDDDIRNAHAQIRYWEARYSHARKHGNARDVTAAAQGLKGARDHLKELQDRRKAVRDAAAQRAQDRAATISSQELEDLQYGVDLAGLTDDTADDIAAQTGIVDYYKRRMGIALKKGDVAGYREALTGYRQAGLDLARLQQNATAGQQGLAEEMKALREAIERQTNYAKSVAGISSYQAVKALADVISGYTVGFGVGPRAATAGSGAIARY